MMTATTSAKTSTLRRMSMTEEDRRDAGGAHREKCERCKGTGEIEAAPEEEYDW